MLSFFFFLKKKGNPLANKILGVYLLLFSFNIIYNVLYWSKEMFTPTYVHLYGILVNFWIAYPPLIYLYVRTVIQSKKLSLKDLIHCIPSVVMILFYAPFYVLSASKKLEALSNGTISTYIINAQYNFDGIIALMIFYVIITYLIFSKKMLGHNKNRWLKWLIGSFTCYVLSMTVYYILSRLGLISTGFDYFITYTLIFFIGLVSYLGFMQPTIFEGVSMDVILPFKKYKKTGLTEQHSKELKETLEYFMQHEKPYLNSDLRLGDLANSLNISRHHMSQIINEHFDTNFFDFINTYRIEESKDLLINEDQMNISDVIYSSGFNNKVSFYKTFKKHTGITPSQYKSK